MKPAGVPWPFPGAIRSGDTGPAVHAWQSRLAASGLLGRHGVHGVFDEATGEALGALSAALAHAPSGDWKLEDLRAYAAEHEIDLSEANDKAGVLAAITAAGPVDVGDARPRATGDARLWEAWLGSDL